MAQAESRDSSNKHTQAIKAITTTLESVFRQAAQNSKTSAKRTVLKRNVGEVMTEDSVIHQMEKVDLVRKRKNVKQTSRASKRSKRT